MKIVDLSVIIPVYNAEEYIRRCLDSILIQSFDNWEAICVDDGSSDQSGSILDEYAKKDARINVVHKANAGSASARRVAVEQAVGKYLICIDADDWIEQGMFLELIMKAKEYDAEIVTSGVTRDYGDHCITDPTYIIEGFYSGEEYINQIRNKMFDSDNFVQFSVSPGLWNKLFLTEMVRPFFIGVPDEIKTDTDTVVSYPALWSANNMYVLDNSWYHYCQNQSSVMHTLNQNRGDSLRRTYDYFEAMYKLNWSGDLFIKKQIECLKIYSWLQFSPNDILAYNDGILSGYGDILPSDRIVLYGAGSYGMHLHKYLTEETDLNIVAWADKSGDGIYIIRPDQLGQIEYDIIIIGVLLNNLVQDIIDYLRRIADSHKRILRFDINLFLDNSQSPRK